MGKAGAVSRERAKGTRFESDVVDVLRAWFPWVERRAPSGARDRGDIAGVPGFALECKNAARMELAAWVDEALTEAEHAGSTYGAVVHKRRGKPAERAYVTMELRGFAALLREAHAHGALRYDRR